MDHLIAKRSLDAGDARHRAVLGQIMAVLVEEMTGNPVSDGGLTEVQQTCLNILAGLAGNYMDKVMDVLLVHYQPGNVGVATHPAVITTLASLSHNHPHDAVPFLKAIFGTTTHLMKAVKPNDYVLKSAFAIAMVRFSDAIL